MQGIRIVVVGVGGGGCKVVDRVSEFAGEGVAIAAVNTDARGLADCRAPTKLQIGRGRTEGLGTGGEVALGRLAAEDDREAIRAALAGANLVWVVVCLGGGTGTGATPVVLDAARAAGAMTLCLATLPFQFEGPQRRSQADRTVLALREACNALIVVPNDRLFESVGETGLAETFARADDVLSTGIAGLCRLLIQAGHINLDFADFQKAVQNGKGICTLSFGEGRGENRADQALAALLQGPLTEKGEVLANAGSLLVSIVGGPDLTVKQIRQIMNAIEAKAPKPCYVTMGTVVDDGWQGKLTVTVVASEASVPPPETDPARDGAAEDAMGKDPIPSRGRRKSGAAAQTKLKLDTGRGRFKDVEPTMQDGEDLDIPTFIRRRIPVER